MAKIEISLKKNLVTIVLTVLISSIIISATPLIFTASAAGSIWVSPVEGKPGTAVTVNGAGFTSRTYVKINETAVVSIPPDSYGSIRGTFTVPDMPAGSYEINATDGEGNTATTTFYVIGADVSPSPSASSTGTPRPTSNPTSSGASSTPRRTSTRTSAASEDALGSPLVIGVIAVVAVVVILFVAFMLRARGGKPRPMYEREESPMPIREAPPPGGGYPPYGAPPSRYGQPTAYQSAYQSSYQSSAYRPAYSSYGQPSYRGAGPSHPSYSSGYSQGPATYGTRTCPYCRRTIKGDYNICPYCHKRIK